MISAGDFKNGLTFEMGSGIFQVVEFQHVKPGKGSSFVRTKLKNIVTGVTLEKSFNPTEKFESAYIEKKTMQFSYSEGDLKYFLDMDSYEMVPIEEKHLGDSFRFVKEEMEVKVLSHKGTIFGVEIPNFVELKVAEADPGIKGNTVTNATKPAKLETGAVIRVPLFINEGDTVKIDTRTGEYIERV